MTNLSELTTDIETHAVGLDPDFDGYTNLSEYGATTDPQDPDSDDDGIPDGIEDTDHDGAFSGRIRLISRSVPSTSQPLGPQASASTMAMLKASSPVELAALQMRKGSAAWSRTET